MGGAAKAAPYNRRRVQIDLNSPAKQLIEASRLFDSPPVLSYDKRLR